MKQDLAHGHGLGYSLFGGQSFAKGDAQAILNLDSALQTTDNSAKAWATTMSKASVSAQNAARETLKTKGSLVDLANGLQQTTVKAKAAELGLKALSVAGNILLYMAIAKGIQWITTYNQRLEESRQEMIEAGKEASQLTKDLDGLVEQYRKLGEGGKLDNSDREQAKSIQEQINSLLGDEAVKVNLINGNYEEQLKILRKIQHEKANNNYATLTDAKNSADESLRSKGVGTVGAGFNEKINGEWETDAIKKLLNKEGFSKYIDETLGGFYVGNYYNDSAEDFIESYNDMIELRTKLSKSYSEEIKEGGKLHDFYKNLDQKIKDMSDAVTKYQDALADYNINEAVIQFNETEFDGITGALIRNEDQLKKWLNSMLASEDISDGVKQELLGLASTYFPDMSDAVGEATKEYIKNQVAAGGDITSLRNLASTCGITEQAFDNLVFATTLFNNKEIDVDSKIAKLRELGYELDVVNTKMNGYYVKTGSKGQYVGDMQIETVDGKRYAVYYDNHNKVIKKELLTKEYSGDGGDKPPYTPSGGDKGKSKDPFDDSYYSIIDALIEDDKKQIEKFEKEYESLNRQFENALDTGNKEQSEILRSKLAENTKAQKDILHQQNEAHRTTQSQLLQSLYVYAPSLSGKSWGDISEVDLTNIENNLNNKVEMEADDNAKNQAKYALNQFKGIVDDLKAINNAINDNSEAWWEADENARGYWQSQIDFQDEYSNEWIDNQKAFDKLTEEEELAAYGRMINNNKEFQKQILNDMSLSEESKLALISETNDKIAEIEKNAYDLRKDVFNKATDFGSSYNDSRKTLLQSYFDTTNSIAEAQHEINKELEASKTMYEWLDEDTRKLLFNQEDYNTLSEELYDIQYKADKLRRQYERDLENSTLDTIEQITSNYEMQYDMLMKSYEIAKADLEIAKKKQKLNNVLNERNVRMFINGQWQWVANTQDVIDAKSELADAEYARRTAEAEKTQTESLNHLTAQQDELKTVINMFESGVIDLGTAVYKVTQMFGSLPSAMEQAFTLITGRTGSGSSGGSHGITYSYNGISYDPNFDYSAAMNNVPVGSDAWNRMNQRRNAKILGEGLPSSMMFASGTRYTPSGNILMGEKEPETFINANGHLIPINQPTLGNFGAGGIVFNQDQMANLRSLWDLSNIGIASHNNLIGANRAQNVDNRVDNSYHVYIQNLEVDNGVIDINALKRYIPIH